MMSPSRAGRPLLPLLACCLLACSLTACRGELSAMRLDGEEETPSTPKPGDPTTPGDPSTPLDPKDPTIPQDPVVDEPARPFACDGPRGAVELPMVRLSQVQYAHSVEDALRLMSPDQEEEQLWAEVAPMLALMPADARTSLPGQTHGGFQKLDQSLQQAHVDQSFEVARAIGERLSATEARRNHLLGACASNATPDDDLRCVEDFLRTTGARLLRAPLTDEDVSFYMGVYDAQGIDAAGLSDVIATLLTAPQFLYHVEHGETPRADLPDSFTLSDYELAARLSYLFWETMPDEELWQAAQNGALSSDASTYEAHVRRLASDPRAEPMLESFVREWLWLDELPELDTRVGTPVFDAFRGDFSPGADLREAMIEEVELLAAHHILDSDSSFSDFLLSNAHLSPHAGLSSLYGLPPHRPGDTPATLSATEGRAGLITRAAMLSSGSANTRPVMKGFRIRQALLCVQPPPPPNNAAGAKVELDSMMNTREVVEAITERPGTSCQGCHQAYLNPLGFATESFDALGRWRQEQVLFDEQGQRTGSRPVSTASIPRVVDLSDDRPARDAGELSELLDQSGLVHACFARHWVRYALSRPEDLALDGCLLAQMQDDLLAGKPLREVMIQIALSDTFKHRTMTSLEEQP